MQRYDWMKVVDVTTKDPVVMTPGETIGQADELMTENSIRQIPVVEGGALAGIYYGSGCSLFPCGFVAR